VTFDQIQTGLDILVRHREDLAELLAALEPPPPSR